jgi:predicted nuclease of predicted toxin-antitoxin system
MSAKLYLDEDVKVAVAESLRKKGYNVIAATEMGNKGFSDPQQLKYAISQERAIMTHNQKDFVKLHGQCMINSLEHYGIIIAKQVNVGEIVRLSMRMLNVLTADDMISRLEYLSNWR